MLLVACVSSSTCCIFENTELTITHSHHLSVVISKPSLSTQHLSSRLHIRYEIKRGLGLAYTLNPLHKNLSTMLPVTKHVV
jgi:hypothetical protein